ncbi:MAG TPA: MATE family efflux transporter [Mobilitalea sp.]|nr:MATE family efflux transporter [Mobilitalea sp.]
MEEKKYSSLGEGTIGKLICKMSIPSVIGILSYNLYNIIDTIYISRGIGALAAGGLAITFPLFILLSAISSTIGSGAASVISRALGRRDIEKASRVAANTFGFFWTVAIIITIAGLVFMDRMLYGMGVTEKLMPYAKEYTRIILLGAVTSTGFSSLIRAEGNSKFAMYLWVIPVGANIILDPIFIFAFKLGVQGAAIATVLSQCVSVAMSLYFFFFSGKSQLRIKLHHFCPDAKIIREIVSIGIPSFLQMAGNSITIILINNILKHYGGDYAISSYGIVNKISTFMIIPLQGIVQGVQPIIGYNYGAGKKQRVGDTLKLASCIAGCYGALVSVMLLFLSNYIIPVFSTDTMVITMGSSILEITSMGLVFQGIYMIQTAYFQSTGNAKVSLLLSLCNYFLCFAPVIVLMSYLYGINGVWYSFPVSAIISLGISTALLLRLRR